MAASGISPSARAFLISRRATASWSLAAAAQVPADTPDGKNVFSAVGAGSRFTRITAVARGAVEMTGVPASDAVPVGRRQTVATGAGRPDGSTLSAITWQRLMSRGSSGR